MTTKQAVANTPVPGTVEPRAANAKTEDQVTIHVTGDQAKAAQTTIDATAKNPGNYVLHGSDSNNCANFAERVVNSAGGSAPHDTTPGQLVIRFIQQILGHEDIKTTQIYTQVALRALQQVYAATHPAAFIEPQNAPLLPAARSLQPGDPAAEALTAALERDAAEDREETGE